MQRRKEALELEREGRYAEAIQKFEEVIALNPTAQNSAIRKGRCWERLGNRAKALESYRQAIEMDPLTYDASEATYRALKVAFAEGDTSTALEMATRMRTLHPDSSYGIRVEIAMREAAGQTTQPLAERLERELKASAAYDDATSQAKVGRVEDALKELKRIWDTYPDTAAGRRAYSSYGHLLIKERRDEEAYEVFREIVDLFEPIAPQSRLVLESKLRLAALLHRGNRHEESHAAYLELMSSKVPRYYLETAALQGAGVLFEIYINKRNANQPVPAEAWERVRQFCKDAEAICSKPVDKARARLMYLESFQWDDQWEKVAIEGQRFLTDFRDEQTTLEQATATFFTGRGFYWIGKYAEAMPYFERCIEWSPNRELWPEVPFYHVQRAYFHLISCLIKTGGSRQRAEALYQTLKTYFPRSEFIPYAERELGIRKD
ncbi:hypothetical protein BRCON_2311 [Candidatus Sumerlaea chitinivorans]|uniref:Tetratricopeptide repeat protein n=1 Tax=Sumerlaea chitinivorans TaxID=2250252 RepID=A0A2Z4Y8E4_SUMC1|nr:hypothetical protein BRCON_2311 [Candidatus Sumerlaea chitinivorans]